MQRWRRWRHSPPAPPIGTRPTSPSCAVLGWSRRRKPKKGGAGQKSQNQGDDRRRPDPARFMRQDFFTFRPAVQAVHRRQPQARLRGVDEAIRRRFNLIPFTVTIPRQSATELADKLKRGMARHPRMGYRGVPAVADGLDCAPRAPCWRPPKTIMRGRRCSIPSGSRNGVSPSVTAEPSARGLFADWREWALPRGRKPGSQKRFSQALGG